MRKFLIATVITTLVLVAGFFALNSYIYKEKQADTIDPKISSYEECIDAGYPSLESYPEQCVTADGKHFVRNLPEDERVGFITSITIQGTLICLPHWDTSGPQTLECAFGLQDDSGNYYVLVDPNPSQPTIGTTPVNTKIEVAGKLIPGSSERYQSIGTIEIEKISPR